MAKVSVTRDDVARRAGVSPATVSYVINEGPRPVAPETREKVQQAIRELGYQPNAVARSLRLQRTSTLGLILPDTHNPYFAEVARGAEHVGSERGFTVAVCHSAYSLERELQYADALHVERAAGVIWIPATANSEPADRLLRYGVPLVVVDRLLPGLQAVSVVADNFHGGYAATEHLIGLGHRRIGFIARPAPLSHSEERVRGYRAALRDHELPDDEALIARGGFRLEHGREAMLYLLGLDPPPTAVFAYNDIMAIGGLRAVYERGLRVPQDFSIVGFDDIPQAAFTCPALTTVSQPKFDMGRRGVEILLNLIAGKGPLAEATAPLEVHLLIRESSGPAPAHPANAKQT